MPIWINALGVTSIGIFYGYILLYTLKRYLPPVSQHSPSLKELALLLVTLGFGGVIGVSVTSIDNINYMGLYGLGLLIGLATNVAFTVITEIIYYWLQIKQHIGFRIEKHSTPLSMSLTKKNQIAHSPSMDESRGD